MDAVEYFKTKSRMTKNCNIGCDNCPLSYNYNKYDNASCMIFETIYPEKAVAIVEKWLQENPVKTYKSVFFEKFPNAPKSAEGYPTMFVDKVFGGTMADGYIKNGWDEEYQEQRP